ncbi:hypothetical protein CERSUDRAFT_73736 [Gelatoporia subvermispora B]|uniref:Glucose-methanol-choline oxidoreductase N-terminal domain-containing protein n=1 Tax=Ceriporiopsis subvermispora (strain B) TaxID=914234 RepID=M2RDZ1_CERS8|nr:hypothetical protein CERSUDRAFT_73736 [Gelatoporia subvermispora B]
MWPFDTPYPQRSSTQLRADYDYIIVGGISSNCPPVQSSLNESHTGGTAGCVLARRLAEDHDATVLLVERGDAGDSFLHRCPLLSTHHWSDRKHSPVLSQYARGTPGDHKGSLWEQSLTHAAERLGFAPATDVNDPSLPTSGCFRIHQTLDVTGQRNSTFRAFLPKEFAMAHAQSLHICTNSIVRNIEIERDGDEELRASGVVVQNIQLGSSSIFVKAKREVVISAGALRSPQILLLSGLGPEEHLKEVGIPVIRNMPGVGSHLQDHVGVQFDFNCPMEHCTLGLIKRPLMLLTHLYKYLVHGEGWLTSSLVEACVLTRPELLDETCAQKPFAEKEKDALSPSNIPEIEIMQSAIVDPRCPEYDQSKGGLCLLVAVLRLESSGTPLCTMSYLTSPRDRTVLRSGLRLAAALACQMRSLGYSLTDVHVPAGLDDAVLDAHIALWAGSYLHYSSTCRMAPEEDPRAPGVVDDELRVHGVRGLRACDASIFPDVPATHLQAPVVAVAEKCADMIKSVWKA